MWDARYWKEKLREAEQELDAATRLADLNEAAKKLMRAKEALKRMELRAGQPRA
jgi:hypothetical protein